MRYAILGMLLLLLPASLVTAEQITVEAIFIESMAKAIPHDLGRASRVKGVDLLCAPRMTTESGQNAQIEVVREYQPTSVAPSGFKPVPIGVIASVTPHLKGSRIAYTAKLTVSELTTRKTLGNQTFSEITSRDFYVSGTAKCGESVWLDLGAREDKQIVKEGFKPSRTQIIQRWLIAVLTFKKA